MIKIIENETISPKIWQDLVNNSQSATFFQTFNWQSVWKKNFKGKTITLSVYEDEKLIGLASFYFIDKEINFLGVVPVLNGQLVQDYGDFIILPQKEQIFCRTIINYFKKNYPKHKLVLDFVRETSPCFIILKNLGFIAEQQDVSPRLKLTASWEEYLSLLTRKNRHELKRKMNRFKQAQATISWVSQNTSASQNDFLALMEDSAKVKSQFLSPKMNHFFQDIFSSLKNNLIIGFAKFEGKKIASVLAFNFKNEILLYNSGFDPNYSRLSPGLVLKAFLIIKAIGEKKEFFDFLRGGERYKYDLGAIDVKLYRLTLSL